MSRSDRVARPVSLLCLALLAACKPSTTPPPAKPAGPLSAKDIMAQSTPAIVSIQTSDDRVGTGFILDKQGLIATNLHVVVGASAITVKFNTGASLPVVRIAGIDPKRDLALLQIQPPAPLPTLTLGDSDRMTAGDPVYAIGNPLGVFTYSISNGLVSARRDACEGIPPTECQDVTYLQISAPISQGSSGGPLLNDRGEVIGVTTAIIAGGQNINLAIPTNYLKPMIAQPVQIGMAEFAKETQALLERLRKERGASPDPNEKPNPPRLIPDHPTAIWDGCKLGDLELTIIEISNAISRGAPEYNKRTLEGYENCYRIYEGTSLKLKSKLPCKGVVKAFDDGIARAETIETYRDKAWAMRDTFDGLLKAADRWCATDPTCRAKAPTP